MNILTAIAMQVMRATAGNGAHGYGTKILSAERFSPEAQELPDVKDINGHSVDGIVSTELDDLALELYSYQHFELVSKNEINILENQIKLKLTQIVSRGEMVSGDLFNVTLQTENHNPILEPELLRAALQSYLGPSMIEEVIAKSTKRAITQEKIYITPVSTVVDQMLQMAFAISLDHFDSTPIEE